MKNSNFQSKSSLLPIAAIIFLISISIGLFAYRDMLQKDLSSATRDVLKNIMEQQRFTFTSKLQDQENSLKAYARFFEFKNSGEQELLEKLNIITRNSTFDYVSYVTPDGDTLENTGTRLNVSNREYFKRSLAGETVISNPVISKVTGKHVVMFSVPVYNKENIIAVLVGIYDAENLSKLLTSSFDGKGYTYITTQEGEIIVKTVTNSSLAVYSNLFEGLEHAHFYDGENADTIRRKVTDNQSGYSKYKHDNEERLIYYAPAGINDWYIYSVAPDEAIAPQTMSIMYRSTLFMIIVSILSIIALIYFFHIQGNHMRELSDLAFVDNLTGAANKKKFKLTATEIITNSSGRFAFVILDIDKFKIFNDTFGYKCGDELLINIARIISSDVTKKEFFGRCDSDEFFILLEYSDDKTIKERTEMMIVQIEDKFKREIDSTYNLVICMGIYVIDNTDESINSISDRARHAHKLTKEKEKSSIAFYSEGIRKQILQEKEIENKMHDALINNNFLLYLQPKYYLHNEKIYGAEALVRWDSGNSTMFYPDQFIPIFEKNGFITELDMYMLEKVCIVIRWWIDSGITPIPVSINFSRMHLKNLNFVDDIAVVVKKYQIPPELIEVELTESTILHNEAILIKVLEQLHAHGFTLSMDDFGSGYSSLGLLKVLPVDVIKLDKTFFTQYDDIVRAKTVISSVITMAKNLDIRTVAEGVETLENIVLLRELGCDVVQGYYYAKPMPAVELKKYLVEEQSTGNYTIIK